MLGTRISSLRIRKTCSIFTAVNETWRAEKMRKLTLSPLRYIELGCEARAEAQMHGTSLRVVKPADLTPAFLAYAEAMRGLMLTAEKFYKEQDLSTQYSFPMMLDTFLLFADLPKHKWLDWERDSSPEVKQHVDFVMTAINSQLMEGALLNLYDTKIVQALTDKTATINLNLEGKVDQIIGTKVV